MTTVLVHGLLPKVYDLLKKGDIEQANRELTEILQQDLENADVIYALTGVNFWIDKLKKLNTFGTSFEKGEFLISHWSTFIQYMQKQGAERENLLYALKQCIFTQALNFYQDLYKEEGVNEYPEVYGRTGLCYKALGDYDRALHLLEEARNRNADSADIIAELADCYALCGETRLAKVFFREAFFLGASEIDLHFLESEIIQRLISQVRTAGYAGRALAEWIPVYGVLYGVLNIKRELRALEFGKLKQAIYLLENEIRDESEENKAILLPRLINHYFWLIDHYVNVNDEQARINEVLLKIKLLDADVYNRYTM